MRPIACALVIAAALPAAAVASTITLDEKTPGTQWDGIVEGFPELEGRLPGNALSVVRRGTERPLHLRSVMEFPLAALQGFAPEQILSATLTFNIDDVLSTLGPGTDLSGQAAHEILVHFYVGDGSALPNDFDRIQEPVNRVPTGGSTITDATLQQTGPIVLTVEATARVRQAVGEGTAFFGVLWRTNDNPTGTSIDDGRQGSSSGEPANTVPGSRMPFITIDVDEATPANCGNGTTDAGEQCDDGNTADNDCCSRICTLDAAGTACNDGNECTAGDACDGSGACIAAGPRNCDDGSTCTSDACEPGTGCVHGPINEGAACDDRNVCTANETCRTGQCVGEGAEGSCDDANPCTANDACAAGQCQGMPADGASCDDGNPCTDDACTAGQCRGAPVDGRPCDDTDACTGSDVCTGGQCAGGTVCGNGALDATCGEECDDGNPGSGDGCSAVCRYDALVGGDGPRECLVRVALGLPVRDGGGAIAAEQACTDGDPACDADETPGSCAFVIGGCFGLADPRLPDCAPASSVKTTVAGGGSKQNRRALVTALRAAAMPGCMQPATVRVPVRGRGSKLRPGKATVALTAKASGLGRDRDTVRLVCRPAP